MLSHNKINKQASKHSTSQWRVLIEKIPSIPWHYVMHLNWSHCSHCSQFDLTTYYLNATVKGFLWAYNVVLKITIVSLIISSFCCHYLYGYKSKGSDTSILLTCSTFFPQFVSLLLFFSSFFPFYSFLLQQSRGENDIKRDLRPCKLWFLETTVSYEA